MTGTDDTYLDDLRSGVLDRIARSERHAKFAFIGAALAEALFLGGFVLLADFHNRVHVLILMSTVAIYSILGMGLVALRYWSQRQTLQILHMLEELRG